MNIIKNNIKTHFDNIFFLTKKIYVVIIVQHWDDELDLFVNIFEVHHVNEHLLSKGLLDFVLIVLYMTFYHNYLVYVQMVDNQSSFHIKGHL